MTLSLLAEGIVGSPILEIATEIAQLKAEGHEITNLTIGDFAPGEFPIPALLRKEIHDALDAGYTNYPPSTGVATLKKAVSDFYGRALGMNTTPENVLVTSGSRPAIYAAFRTLVDPGDRVVFGVPCWNTGHYCQLVGAIPEPVPCAASDNFLPVAANLESAVRGARLLALCSPSNPTGTMFTAEALTDICNLVVAENRRRGPLERPLYLLYDQVYWMLTFDGRKHVYPTGLVPEVAPYTVYIDGMSKNFAATGLRVGWAVAPKNILKPMGELVGHIGAWAPRPEQFASGEMLNNDIELSRWRTSLVSGVQERLQALHDGLSTLQDAGLPVESIAPMGAIYLSARFPVINWSLTHGNEGTIRNDDDLRKYLLHAAGIGVVPFQCFGAPRGTGWVRLSVGAVSVDAIDDAIGRLSMALESLEPAIVV